MHAIAVLLIGIASNRFRELAQIMIATFAKEVEKLQKRLEQNFTKS